MGESGNLEPPTRICSGTGSESESRVWGHSSWEEGLAPTTMGGLWEEQVWKEKQDLLSDKVNVRCCGGPRGYVSGGCWMGESGFRTRSWLDI